MNVQPLILCGGSGTRMWPLSREQFPKQLLSLAGESSMLQATVQRLTGLPLAGAGLAAPILIGNEEYRFLMAEQLRQIGVRHGGMVLGGALRAQYGTGFDAGRLAGAGGR